MLLQSVQQVKSEVATNPSFNLVYNRLTTTAPETAESSNSWLKDEFSLLHASIISGILCFILIIIIFMCMALSEKIQKAYFSCFRTHFRW